MRKRASILRWKLCVLLVSILHWTGLAQDRAGEAADLKPAWEERSPDLIRWEPKSRYPSLRLVVVNRDGLVHEQVFEADDPVFLEFVDRRGDPLPDGRYSYELRAAPVVDDEVRRVLELARLEGDSAVAKARLRQAGLLPRALRAQTGIFHLKAGRLEEGAAEPLGGDGLPGTTLPDSVANVTLGGNSNWELQSPFDLQFVDNTVTPSQTPVVFERGGEPGDVRLHLAASGSLGLGTAAPVEELHIVADDTPAIRLHQSAGLFPLQEWDLGCNLAGNETAFFVRDETAGTVPFVVTAGTGNVGLGTQTPSGNLHIFGTATDDVFAGMGPDLSVGPALNYGDSGSSFGRGAGFFNVRPDAQASAPNPSLRFATDNLPRMIIDNEGFLGLGANLGFGLGFDPAHPVHHMDSGAHLTAGGRWTDASSREFKHQIRDLDEAEAMQTVLKLRPVEFRYRTDPGERNAGFIAEEVPDLVATADRRGLSAMDIVAVLTKVVQRQQREIRALSGAGGRDSPSPENERLKRLVVQLSERLARLEGLVGARSSEEER